MPKYIPCRVINVDTGNTRIYVMWPKFSKEIIDITGPFNLLAKVTYKKGYIKKLLPKRIPAELFLNAIVAEGVINLECVPDLPWEEHIIDEVKTLNLWCSSSQCLLRMKEEGEESDAREKIKDYIEKLSNMP